MSTEHRSTNVRHLKQAILHGHSKSLITSCCNKSLSCPNIRGKSSHCSLLPTISQRRLQGSSLSHQRKPKMEPVNPLQNLSKTWNPKFALRTHESCPCLTKGQLMSVSPAQHSRIGRNGTGKWKKGPGDRSASKENLSVVLATILYHFMSAFSSSGENHWTNEWKSISLRWKNEKIKKSLGALFPLSFLTI